MSFATVVLVGCMMFVIHLLARFVCPVGAKPMSRNLSIARILHICLRLLVVLRRVEGTLAAVKQPLCKWSADN